MRGFQDFESLNQAEKIRFDQNCHVGIQTHQITFMQWKKKLLDDEYWSFCIRYTAEKLLIFPGPQQWWRAQRHLFPRDYVTLIDLVIEEQDWKTGWQNMGKYLDRQLFQAEIGSE